MPATSCASKPPIHIQDPVASGPGFERGKLRWWDGKVYLSFGCACATFAFFGLRSKVPSQNWPPSSLSPYNTEFQPCRSKLLHVLPDNFFFSFAMANPPISFPPPPGRETRGKSLAGKGEAGFPHRILSGKMTGSYTVYCASLGISPRVLSSPFFYCSPLVE